MLWLTFLTAHATETGAIESDLPRKVIVQKGDVLSSLLTREIGRSNPALWKRVAAYNNRTVNQTLEVGDVLLIPAELMASKEVAIDGYREVSLIEHTQLSASKRTAEPAPPPANKPSTESAQLPANSPSTEPVQPLANRHSTKTTENDTQITPDTLSTEAQAKFGEQSKRSVDAPNKVAKDRPTQAEAVPEEQPELSVKEQQPKLEEEKVDSLPPEQPGLFEVDEDSAGRALERSLTQLNALLLRPRRAEVTFSLDYSFNEESEPVLVVVEDTTTGDTVQQAGQLKRQETSTTTVLDLKFGLPYKSQINLSLPFSSISRDFDVIVPGSQSDNQSFTSGGAGDFAITVNKTLAIESGKRPDLIFNAAYNSDTGDDEVGSNAEEFSFGVSVTKRQDPLVFTASVSRTTALESDIGVRPGAATQFSIGTLLAASPYTSMRFLFTQASVASAELNGQSLPNSDANIASFVTGVSSVLGADLFLNAQLSIGLVDQASNYRLSFSIARQFSY